MNCKLEAGNAQSALLAVVLRRQQDLQVRSKKNQPLRSNKRTRSRASCGLKTPSKTPSLGKGAFLKDEILRSAKDGRVVRLPGQRRTSTVQSEHSAPGSSVMKPSPNCTGTVPNNGNPETTEVDRELEELFEMYINADAWN